YDVLGRPDRSWARNDATLAVTLRGQVSYGDGGVSNQPANVRNQALAANRLGKAARQLDEAGELVFDAYDFKGNLVEKVRRVVDDAHLIAALNNPGGPAHSFLVDWDRPPALSGIYRVSYRYDALNRIAALQCPQDVDGNRKTLVPGYNRAGALE